MYNRELSSNIFPNEKAVQNGVAITAEGQLLVSVMEDGIEKVKPCAGVAAEVPVGFSTSTRLFVDKEVVVKNFSIPSSAPYTVALGHTNLISGQIAVYIAGVLATVVVGAPTAGEVQPDYALGVLTFAAADAGKAIQVFYKRNLTVAEARELYREGFLFNARAFEVYQKVGVFQGKGYIYTDQYDVSAEYGVLPLKTFATGLVSTAGAGTDVSAFMRVIAVPSLSNPFLGIEFNL